MRRQREMLVQVLEMGRLEFTKKEGGYAGPWDLKMAILGPFGDDAVISLPKCANSNGSFQKEPNIVLDF